MFELYHLEISLVICNKSAASLKLKYHEQAQRNWDGGVWY